MIFCNFSSHLKKKKASIRAFAQFCCLSERTMTDTISLLLAEVSPSKQHEICCKLVESLDTNEDSLKSLCTILDYLPKTSLDEVYPTILRYCKGALAEKVEERKDEIYNCISQLVRSLPQLSDDLMLDYVKKLKSHLLSADGFIADIKKLVKKTFKESSETDMVVLDSLHLENILDFFEYLFRTSNSALTKDIELDTIAVFYLGSTDEFISRKASEILRWRINHVRQVSKNQPYLWEVIFLLLQSHLQSHKDEALRLWLRYISTTTSDLDEDSYYQSNLKNRKEYWEVIQNELTNLSHEKRKLGLALLKHSIKSINESFDNSIMRWDISKRDSFLKEWERFVTLFEILGVDTSLHQAEAAVKDIVELISPRSLIHPSWGYCLLSTGFRASMESVRKFSLSVLYAIPSTYLRYMKDALGFFETYFLPYGMQASHFAVRNYQNSSKTYCAYGDTLKNFIHRLLSELNEEDTKKFVSSILKVLNVSREGFDPARFYVLLGVASSLNGKQYLDLENHEELIVGLYESRTESPLINEAIETLLLKITFSFRVQEIGEIINLLSKFVKFNGYDTLIHNIEDISNFIFKNDLKADDIECYLNKVDFLTKEEAAVTFMLIYSYDPFKDLLVQLLDKSSDIVLCHLLKLEVRDIDILSYPNIQDRIQNTLSKITLGSNGLEYFSSVSALPFHKLKNQLPSSKDVSKVWEDINAGVQSSDEQELRVSTEKLILLNKVLDSSEKLEASMFDLKSLIRFDSLMFVNSKDLCKKSKNLYKVKDHMKSEYYKLLNHLIQKNQIVSDSFQDIFDLLCLDSNYYIANVELIKLINEMIARDDKGHNTDKYISMLSTFWENLRLYRLQLNHKDLHVLFIQTLFQPKLLTSDKELHHNIFFEIGESLIISSHGRRCLLPTLTKCLSNFQIANQNEFESYSWTIDLLFAAFTHQQLRNNVFKLENIIGRIFDEEITKSDGSDIYRKYYDVEEISSRVNLITIFNSIKSPEFATKIINMMLDKNSKLYVFRVIKSTDGLEEWTRIQLLTIALSVLDKLDSKVFISQFIEVFINAVESEPSPLVRVYLEWIITLKMLDSGDDRQRILDTIISKCLSPSVKPANLTSFERILYLYVQQLESKEKINVLSKLLTIVVPGATSNKAVVRHFSASLIFSIYPEIKHDRTQFDPYLFEVVENVYSSAENTDNFGKYRSGDAMLWNVKADQTLVGISGDVLMRVSEKDVDLLTEDEFAKYVDAKQKSHLNKAVGKSLKSSWIKERKIIYQRSVITDFDLNSNSEQSPLQTKSGALNTLSENDTQEQHSVHRSDLIVVSSLVDKPPNLGGICRLCDVLGAGLLTLNDIRVKDHPQFKNVAVTADSWMPMKEVKEEGIRDFLKSKKSEGYTLIGLEQTDKSVELNSDLKFPQKSLILLGKEREGIPGDLLVELDMCIEIKQVGVVRSMNIQTATAIIVHAYSSQHC
ncbi:Piso0_003162 [Millerozyma farinosa CBS 7064]|uniref:Piso0_003162 protein n=1 Tax=Pichia sorbitophila (strain ATCC MYA-4447 / BCRC 22081 / CBS 7064 / NBRC 10061 / NRRL Y-12695) TaxID=559304 RepID=G8YKI5_PICSO|nr:Piso0_003162 [Millerozyma farinosa CBS 7064]CCE80830.1 Piso0_003162 [Millerozyma farinosa CBS 7064]